MHRCCRRLSKPWLLNGLHLQRPLCPVTPRLSVKLHSSFSSPSRPDLVPHCLDEECSDFLPWLQRKAAVEISSLLSIGKSIYGRSLFASKSIRAGDSILRVPFSVQISPDNLLPEIKSLLGDEVGHVARLAAVVLIEQQKAQDSEWGPYISRLPQAGEMQSTIFWSEGELEMIKQSSVYQQTFDKRLRIKKEFLALKHDIEYWRFLLNTLTCKFIPKSCGNGLFAKKKCEGCILHMFDSPPIHGTSNGRDSMHWRSPFIKLLLLLALDHIPKAFEGITFKEFMHAYALVESRAWESSKGYSLIPFADFLNHDRFAEAVVLNDEQNQFSEVIADRNFAPGEQVMIAYGKFSNAILLLDFGFTLPHNIYDEVHIQLKVCQEDPLYEMKSRLLQKHCSLATAEINILEPSTYCFTIKEVRSPRGKGTGIPQSLRAAARILSCSSPKELSDMVEEASQNDGRLGRRPPKIINKEIQAHQYLLLQITELINEYHASAELNAPVVCPRSHKDNMRRLMARDLLAGELRILKSAFSWLTNYTTDLSQQRASEWSVD